MCVRGPASIPPLVLAKIIRKCHISKMDFTMENTILPPHPLSSRKMIIYLKSVATMCIFYKGKRNGVVLCNMFAVLIYPQFL